MTSNNDYIPTPRVNETGNVDIGIKDIMLATSYPQVDFPFTFYNFINEVSTSHPHIVAWSECGNYFKIERHASALPSLIGQHFQRKSF